MEPRRGKTKKNGARREAAARLAVLCAFAVCAVLMLAQAVEYGLSFRRESMTITASAGETVRAVMDDPGGRMDINAAAADDLKRVPGVGPELARRILALREERGGFSVLEEVMDVNGIGEKRFRTLKEYFFCPLRDSQRFPRPPSL